jgi:hypothetical protein
MMNQVTNLPISRFSVFDPQQFDQMVVGTPRIIKSNQIKSA